IAARQETDIILADVTLGCECGPGFLSHLLEAAGGVRILAIMDIVDPEIHLQAVRMGAMGVLLMTDSANSLFKAIRKVYGGEVWLNRSVLSAAVLRTNGKTKSDPESAKIATLTNRERDVIACLGHGLKNRQIGEHLFISEKTV